MPEPVLALVQLPEEVGLVAALQPEPPDLLHELPMRRRQLSFVGLHGACDQLELPSAQVEKKWQSEALLVLNILNL